MATFSKLNIALTGTATGLFKTLKSAETRLGRFSRTIGGVTKRIAGLGLGITGLAGTAGLVSLIRRTEEFNQAMANSTAIMGDLSNEMRTGLTDAANSVALAFRFSAKEAAESFFFLASAGLDAKQSIAALPQVAAFAQAGNFGLALATDLVTDAQSALGLTVKDSAKNLENLTRVTDVLVKGNKLANTSVQQLSEAIVNKAGVAARGLGKDIEEVAAVLLGFADQGKKGADAGTLFDIALRELQLRAILNKKAFKELNIEVFDTFGEMNNLADIIQDLEIAFAGLGDEQRKVQFTTLGFQEKSQAAIKILLGTSEAVRGYEKNLRSAGGFTREVAEKQLPPFTKAMSQLSAVIDIFAQKLGGPVLTSLAGFLGEITVIGLAIKNMNENIDGSSSSVDGMDNSFKVLNDTLSSTQKVIVGIAEFIERMRKGILILIAEFNRGILIIEQRITQVEQGASQIPGLNLIITPEDVRNSERRIAELTTFIDELDKEIARLDADPIGERLTKALRDAAKQLDRTEEAAEGIFDSFVSSVDSAIEAVGKLGKTLQEIATEELTKELTKNLTSQIDQGLTDALAEGIPDIDIKPMVSVDIEAIEDALSDLRKSVETPSERIGREFRELLELEEKAEEIGSGFDPRLFERKKDELRKGLRLTIEGDKAKPQSELINLLDIDSRIQQAALKKEKEISEKQLEEQEKATRLLEIISKQKPLTFIGKN